MDERRTEVGRKSNEHRTSRAQSPLLRWQVAVLHYSSWQRNTVARPVERYNSLLWWGRQNVATRCYGGAGRALQLAAMVRPAAGCSSLLRQWSAALQLAALGRERAAALANATLQHFCFLFFLYSTTSREKERERQKEKGRESL